MRSSVSRPSQRPIPPVGQAARLPGDRCGLCARASRPRYWSTARCLRSTIPVLCLAAALLATAAHAVPSLVKAVTDNVTMVFDDADNWGGNMSMNVTHQHAPPYQAKKVLDLTDVSAAVWDNTTAVRLSLYLTVHDYSWHELPAINGLDEAFEILVNGQSHVIPMNAGAPEYKHTSAPRFGWYDIPIPKGELTRGPNEIIIHKAPGKIADPNAKPDDYLYLGIDTSRRRGNSSVTYDGTNWIQKELTVPGGNGEYMVRLYLMTGSTDLQATWRPGQTPDRDDPAKIILYAGARGTKPAADGLKLSAGQAARMEWHSSAFDNTQPVEITAQATGALRLQWLNTEGGAVKEPAVSGLSGALPPTRTFQPSGLLLTAGDGGATLQSVTASGGRSTHPPRLPANIAPVIAAAPKAVAAKPACRLDAKTAILTGGYLQATFDRAGKLQLRSLRNLLTKTEMLPQPGLSPLFLVEVDGKRYAGSRDFKLTGLKPVATGFVASLAGPVGGVRAPALQASVTVTMTPDGLRMGMNLTNVGAAPVDFKLAFPVVSGVAVSQNPADDYYFYPSGGGIINIVPGSIRRGYGDYEAMYQVMDVFSPARGCGLLIRATDAEGWHKVLALRKFIPETAETNYEQMSMSVKEEYKWKNPLEPVTGTSFAYEYQRRTRAPRSQAVPAVPGDANSLQKTTSFAPSDALLAVHPGDWHVAMQTYADWAHRVWKFRPTPSKLLHVRCMDCAGWGQGILFKDGKYRTDFITPMTDIIELMSWWDWSPLGPYKTPFDQLDKIMTPGEIKGWEPYFVKDPVTGQQMWNNNPGDYKGYNERFGGLPAFREAVRTYQKMGSLVTLYTDPFRLDGNCEIGEKYGEQWSVVNLNDKKSTGYDVWNPCHDLPEVREWSGTTMGRLMRETGADGIRLDEYGHRGWACYDKTHKHTWQEPGITQWQKGVSEACRLAHAEMDKVKPGLILTTEHPGYDYMLQYLEGCITYDYTVQACPLRPLECNGQRFYFPECKPYELDHRGADDFSHKKFWNGEESFERHFPLPMYHLFCENENVYQGRDNTPLLPTLAPFVYANRFAGAGKTMWHLYNATGHTFEGEVLRIPLGKRVGAPVPGAHVVELLTGQELPVVNGKVSLYLDRDGVACIAILPRVLQLGANGQVTIRDGKGGTLIVANAKAEHLLTQDAKGGAATLDLSKLPAGAKPAYVKLLRGGQLVDTAQWPGGAE